MSMQDFWHGGRARRDCSAATHRLLHGVYDLLGCGSTHAHTALLISNDNHSPTGPLHLIETLKGNSQTGFKVVKERHGMLHGITAIMLVQLHQMMLCTAQTIFGLSGRIFELTLHLHLPKRPAQMPQVS